MSARHTAPTTASEIRPLRPVRIDEKAPDPALAILRDEVRAFAGTLSDPASDIVAGAARRAAALADEDAQRGDFLWFEQLLDAVATYAYVMGLMGQAAAGAAVA